MSEESTFAIQTLPHSFQHEILNHFPLDDLIRYCLANQLAATICSDPAYFQQRLIAKGGDVNLFQKTPFTDPVAKYVYSLVMSGKINTDSGALAYLLNSEILFPGLEYFIGLSMMGVRAIKNNSSDFLLYVLKKYPSLSEQKRIIGELYRHYVKSFQPYILPWSIMRQLFEAYRPEVITTSFYPGNVDEYRIYLNGVYGNTIPVDEINGVNEMYPYLYGLIDGDHIDLLLSKIQEISQYSNFRVSSPVYLEVKLTEYMIANRSGSVEMFTRLNEMRTKGSLIDLYKLAVLSNNLDITRYILSEYPDFRFIKKIYPGSVMMLNLLIEFGVILTGSDILAGSLRSGNSPDSIDSRYKLWKAITKRKIRKLDVSHFESPRDTHDFYREIFIDTPPYMLQQYIRGAKPDQDEINQMITVFINNEDFYRLEMMISETKQDRGDLLMTQIGTDVPLETAVKLTQRPTKLEIIGMFTNPMMRVFGTDLTQYPRINDTLKS